MVGSIYLFRHAEAGWGGQATGDKARQLSDVGHRSSNAMGQWFKSQEHSLDLILCSPAVRAQETMDGFLSASGLSPKIETIEGLYLAPPDDILETMNDALKRYRGRYQHIMVIGHNPGMHQVSFDLAVGSKDQMDPELTTSYPPAGLTGFSVSSHKPPLKKQILTYLFFKHPGTI